MANSFMLRDSLTGALVYLSKAQSEALLSRQSVVTVTDAPTIIIDASAGNFFQIDSPGNRSLGIPINPPAAGETQRISVVWKNTDGATRQLTPVVPGAGSWRLGSDVTFNNTQAGRKLRFEAVYDPVDQRWDVVLKNNGIQ